ncbi:MAG: ABC transporter substrate-binding protein [Oscillospiraceae bacterium]|nr:ABC transporter substrate-binding protein [Oscillospiraceae bacterium]
MKKILALFLLSALILITIISCGNSSKNETNNPEAIVADPQNTETTRDPELPNIADADYNNRDFLIYYINWSLYKDYYFADSQNGEIINDACYDRTALIEEKLNINITTVPTTEANGGLEQINKMRACVMANDDIYDLLLLHNSTMMATFIADRLVLNWNDIPVIDRSKSYWNQSVSKNLNINGMLPFASNDFILPDVNSIFFHTQLLDDLNLENPYEIVNDGRWTWDKLIQMASVASADIDGDGVFTAEDRYGFVGEFGWQFGSVPTSCNQYTIKIDSDGKPQLNINTPVMIGLMEKIERLIKADNISFTWGFSQVTDPNLGGTPPVSFNSGRALFYMVPLSLAKLFREMDVDFGIIPLPKYNEAQENYITLNWAGFLSVPLTVQDTELVGKVVELLGYYNKQIVIPMFYDILLGQKISRDDRSNEMLNIIFKNSVYDLGVVLDSPFYCITLNVVNSKNGFASYYTANENSLQKIIDDYYKAHVEYMEIK